MLDFPIQLMLAAQGGDPVVVLEQQKLLGDPNTYSDFFGCAVDIDGGRLAIGALGWGHWTCTGQGAVHIYERVAGEWEEQAMLSTGVCISLFGESLDLEGDRLAVGASSTDFQSGRVHVFEHSAPGWLHTAELSIGGFDRYYFGHSVALDGTTLAAGAIGVANDQGRVAVFEFDGTTWVDTVHLQASDAQDGDQFGWSVALEGDTLLVGVPWRAEPGLGADAGPSTSSSARWVRGPKCRSSLRADGRRAPSWVDRSTWRTDWRSSRPRARTRVAERSTRTALKAACGPRARECTPRTASPTTASGWPSTVTATAS